MLDTITPDVLLDLAINARKTHDIAPIYDIYVAADAWMRAGNIEACDALFTARPIRDMSVDLIIGLLTATLPVRDKQPSRAAFVAAKSVLFERGCNIEDHLRGIE